MTTDTLSSASSKKDVLLWEPVARRLGVVLLAGFAAVIALAGWDESRKEQLETLEEKTAVGDRHYFQPQEGTASVVIQGETWTIVSPEKVEFRDSRMTPVAKDDSQTVRIYRETKEQEGKGRDRFMKIAPNEYLRIRRP